MTGVGESFMATNNYKEGMHMKQKKLARMLAIATSVFMLAGETLPAFAAGTEVAADDEVVIEATEEDAEGEGEEPGPGEEHAKHQVTEGYEINYDDAACPKVVLTLNDKPLTRENDGLEVECEVCHKTLQAFLGDWHNEGEEACCDHEVVQNWKGGYFLAEEGKDPQEYEAHADDVHIPATGIHSYLRESRCTPGWWWTYVDEAQEWRPIASVRCDYCQDNHDYRLEDEELSMTSRTENGVTTYTATLTLAGGYDHESGKADRTITFSNDFVISENNFYLRGVEDLVYTGKPLKQENLKVYCGGGLLAEGTDYTVKYSNNKNAGTANVTVTGKGKYKGSLTQNFTIAKADLSDECYYVPDVMLTYTGKAQKKVALLYCDGVPVPKSAYTVEYIDQGNYTDGGGYQVLYKAKNANYTGSRTSWINISGKEEDFVSTAKAKLTINPEYFRMTAWEGVDMGKINECDEDGKPKAYTVTLQGKDITAAFPRADFCFSNDNGKGFLFVYSDPNAEVEGQRYWGTVSAKVSAKQTDINGLKLECPDSLDWPLETLNTDMVMYRMGLRLIDKDAEGNEFPLEAGRHYTISLKNNKKAGRAMTVTISGREAYCGKIVKKIQLNKVDLKKAYENGTLFLGQNIDGEYVMPEEADFAAGGAILQWIEVGRWFTEEWDDEEGHHSERRPYGLTEGTDYIVKYTDNGKAGQKARIIISGKGNYCGEIVKEFTVKERNIERTEEYFNEMEVLTKDVVLNAKAKNMKAYMAKVEVFDLISEKKLKEGKDYTLKYYRYTGPDGQCEEFTATDAVSEGLRLGDAFRVEIIAKEGSGFTGSFIEHYRVVEKQLKASDVKLKDQVLAINEWGTMDDALYFARPGFPEDGGMSDIDPYGAGDEEYAAWAAKYFEKVPAGCRFKIVSKKNFDKAGKPATVILKVVWTDREESNSYTYGGYVTVKFKIQAKDLAKN